MVQGLLSEYIDSAIQTCKDVLAAKPSLKGALEAFVKYRRVRDFRARASRPEEELHHPERSILQ